MRVGRQRLCQKHQETGRTYIRGGQYALSKILLAETMKAAHDKYRVESEKMEDLEFQYFQNHLNAAETRVISQQVKSAGG